MNHRTIGFPFYSARLHACTLRTLNMPKRQLCVVPFRSNQTSHLLRWLWHGVHLFANTASVQQIVGECMSWQFAESLA